MIDEKSGDSRSNDRITFKSLKVQNELRGSGSNNILDSLRAKDAEFRHAMRSFSMLRTLVNSKESERRKEGSGQGTGRNVAKTLFNNLRSTESSKAELSRVVGTSG